MQSIETVISAHCRRLCRLRPTMVVPRADLIDRFTGSGKRTFMQITIRDQAALAEVFDEASQTKQSPRYARENVNQVPCRVYFLRFLLPPHALSFAFCWSVNLSFPRLLRFFPGFFLRFVSFPLRTVAFSTLTSSSKHSPLPAFRISFSRFFSSLSTVTRSFF